jgi:hypothetical protein
MRKNIYYALERKDVGYKTQSEEEENKNHNTMRTSLKTADAHKG